ncbi:hypothetical protein VL20_3898 [Microcystis panniformis FACHB-1757]|uniref:DNA gyrase subunit A n=1 Tax=Microcystis panniformis FACHB-1757 TaxID=1638788 RepID=A0A0K1S478_9CHRO|nr:hypothetical protein VL20_3898 [Microcystis panniformis FACHB-1757]
MLTEKAPHTPHPKPYTPHPTPYTPLPSPCSATPIFRLNFCIGIVWESIDNS